MDSLRILIVEDDALLAVILAELLAEMGHAVAGVAATAEGAAAAAARLRPDLILIDVHLAHGDGVAAIAAIAAERPVAHVYLTGDPAAVERAAPGAVVLCKPFSETHLAKAIQQARQQDRRSAPTPRVSATRRR